MTIIKALCACAIMAMGFRIEIHDMDNGWTVFGGALVVIVGFVWLMMGIWQ